MAIGWMSNAVWSIYSTGFLSRFLCVFVHLFLSIVCSLLLDTHSLHFMIMASFHSRSILAMLLIFIPFNLAQSTLNIQNQSYTFQHQQSLNLGQTPLTLYWSLNGTSVRFAVKTVPPPQGWVGLGFNKQGRMTPANAVIALKVRNSQVAQVLSYRLASHQPSGVQPTPSSAMTNPLAEYNPDGSVVMAFSMDIASEPALSSQYGVPSGLIYAIGPQPAATTALTQHTQYGSAQIGLAGGFKTQSDNSERSYIILLHAMLMAVAWLVIAPIASFFASPNIRRRFFPKDTSSNPRYTRMHRVLMFSVVIFASLGFLIGYAFIGTRTFIVHFAIGTAVLVLMVFQATLGFWRTRILSATPPTSGLDRFAKINKNGLSAVHAWTGRVTWMLAAVNVYFGLQAAPDIFDAFWTVAAGIATALGVAFFLAGPLARFWLKSYSNGTVKPPSSKVMPPAYTDAPPLPSQVGFGPGGYEAIQDPTQPPPSYQQNNAV